MPTARRSRTIAAPAQQLWELVCDPHHLPRWWPRVTRVEDVASSPEGETNAFTQVMRTRKGKLVRADYSVRRDEATRTLTWVQRVEGTPFASVLRSAETELRLTPAGAGTEVAIELRQEMARGSLGLAELGLGSAPRFAGRLVRRAAEATLEQALDGLQQISA